MYKMTELEELENIYCEMHKDVHGVKARWYRAENVEQARKDIARLEEQLAIVIAEEKAAQERAITAFNKLKDEHCKGDFETAVRFQHQAYDTNGDDEYLEYRLGLPYKYFAKQRQALTA